jgi:hypothetical protein
MNGDALPLDALFRVANTSALLAWVALIALPRWPWLRQVTQWGVVGALCTLYSVLIFVYFFTVPGGGFGDLASVQRLFTSREVALAGWVHYLAFDLLVGLWIAQRADSAGMSRLMQSPLLLATFMFGPFGLLWFALQTTWQRKATS